jgi:hypothetical protein
LARVCRHRRHQRLPHQQLLVLVLLLLAVVEVAMAARYVPLPHLLQM